MVTRVTPGTAFMPSFCTALRLFFSERLCLPRWPEASVGVSWLGWGRVGGAAIAIEREEEGAE